MHHHVSGRPVDLAGVGGLEGSQSLLDGINLH